MSRILSCNAIVDHALREIGTFSPYDLSSDPAEHEIGLERLDLIIAEQAGIENLWFLRPARQTVPIPASMASFALSPLLGSKLQFFDDIRVILPESPTVEEPVEMLRRSQYDEISTKDATGNPCRVYIERNDTPTIYIHPAASRTGLLLVIDGQAYAATALDNHGQNASGFPAAWQRYLIMRLAADLGSGPVKTIPADERQQKKQEAAEALALLLPRNNREQVKQPRFVQPYDPLASSGRRVRRDYGQ